MAKYNGTLVVIQNTNICACFYLKYLLELKDGDTNCPPVQYYDRIDKNGIEAYIEKNFTDDNKKYIALRSVMHTISNFNKTVHHGFKCNIIQDDIRNEGEAINLLKYINKQIKNHDAPFNDILTEYSAQVLNQ